MPQNQPTQAFSLVRMVRKFFVSGFVVFTFIAYALHERLVRPAGGISAGAPTRQSSNQAPSSAAQLAPTATALPTAGQLALATPQPPSAPPATAPLADAPPAPTAPQSPPAPAAPSNDRYKDGQYSGGVIDAFYGLVQVQAVIQQGKIMDVQFLEYPNDRRTSIRINRIAMPALTSEAIQAQSANVDTITGATLTSEAFVMSLQMALKDAQG